MHEEDHLSANHNTSYWLACDYQSSRTLRFRYALCSFLDNIMDLSYFYLLDNRQYA